ncbi:MAG: AraC family transcriptional regulator [Gordonia sp. (in: high G+C Gram-positive bacteria)]|uniref:AraC family transcriptional regulator n=1 Tax=Gordonia sp. (in: high G+C Gram-positive bacteria) TaxID=84139 RepID=UPI0039E671BA
MFHTGPDTPVVHRTFKSSDPSRVHDHVAATFAEHDLRLGDGDPRFRLEAAVTGGVTVGRMAYGTQARLDGPAMHEWYHVNLLVSGSCTVAQRDERASFSADREQSGVVFGPDDPVFIDWSGDAAQYHLKLPRESFEAHAARLAGQTSPSTIDFDLTFPLDSPAGKSLSSSVAFYYSQLASEGGISTMPLVQRELESALMTQVLLVARSNLTPRLLRGASAPADDAVRAAVEHIDRNAKTELSIASLAEHCRTSARSLQIGFRRTIGVTPSEYIRNTRLDGARADLLARDGDSVSEIAHRWHFFHLGRFANHYRERFGESPSQTFRHG